MTFTASIPSHLDTPEELLQAMRDLRQQVDRDSYQTFARWRPSIQRRGFLPGAVNLAAYLALREHDLRELQTALMPWGLSSLGRSEARVMASLDAVIASLAALAGESDPPRPQRLNRFFQGDRLLRFNTDQVFGPPPSQRRVRVMVTFPSEAARDEAWVRDMVRRGMDVARINTAHDHEGAWGQMIASIRKAAQIEGRNVRVFMDLAGPKVRTAEIHQPDNKKQRLQAGDLILLTRKKPDKDLPYEFQVQSAVPEPLDQVAVGDPVWFDDGQMQTVVTQLAPEGAVLRVIRVGKGGYRLKREKGMNFPETDLRLSPLSPADRDVLDFVARHADQVGYSFVQEPSDIVLLQELLAQRMERPDRIALIAKIETPRAVRNLPELIVQGAGRQPFGLMIARGDLAVELGFERMAEMQEQILWLAEAAHVPVIWATQVLETFVKQGVPSRSEMTDAAMSSRAECVMLNKGPYAGEAVSLLNDVLHRMRDHYHKKAPQLRALRSWKDSSRPAD